MAPLEDETGINLPWISEFVTQQVLITMRPILDHMQHADAAVDYTQRGVQELSREISELQCEVDRTNKYLVMMRQGLGIQNESHCSLKVGVENTTKRVKRMEDQIEELVGGFFGIKDSVGSMILEVRGVQTKHDEMATHIVENISLAEDLRKKLETVILDSQGFRALRDDLYNNDARLERQLRELRQDRLGISKLEEEFVPSCSQHSSQSCRSGEWPVRKSSLHGKTGNTSTLNNSGSCDVSSAQHLGASLDEPSPQTRLPLLAMPGISRPADVATRLRFS